MIGQRHRVMITGLGVVAPNGIGVEAFWRSLLECRSGIRQISLFDTSDLPSTIAGEITDFDVRQFVTKPVSGPRTARHTQMALAATILALRDAERAEPLAPVGDVPLCVGVSSSAFDLMNRNAERIATRGYRGAAGFVVSDSIPGAVASSIAEHLPFAVCCETISNACPSGLEAIARAADLVRQGRCDVALAGGTDSPIELSPFANFVNADLASTHNEAPERASRPFDLNRDTGVISEGAGMIVLERMERALARGATIYAEVLGYGAARDPRDAEMFDGLAEAITQALYNACRRPEQVDYICAHGPGHPEMDWRETEIIKRVFKAHARRLAISSIKGVLGNPMAAAAPLQVVASSLALRHGIIPPTANCEVPDPRCDLDYVPEGPRYAEIDCAIVNAHGVSSNNCCMVLGRVAGPDGTASPKRAQERKSSGAFTYSRPAIGPA